MQTLVQELVRVLQMMTDRHRRMLRLTERQRQALVNGQTDVLSALVVAVRTEAADVVEAERQRAAAARALAEALGVRPEGVTVTEIVRHLDRRSAEVLVQASEDLKSVIRDLALANERNAALTAFSLRYVDKLIETVAAVGTGEQYGPTQRMPTAVRMFDRQV
ncbi:MAG: flagellar protein FlgN [Alicyclobacillus sp.]|nr:flagellar protein FlgN [Alicyclobacillus sp.]